MARWATHLILWRHAHGLDISHHDLTSATCPATAIDKLDVVLEAGVSGAQKISERLVVNLKEWGLHLVLQKKIIFPFTVIAIKLIHVWEVHSYPKRRQDLLRLPLAKQ